MPGNWLLSLFTQRWQLCGSWSKSKSAFISICRRYCLALHASGARLWASHGLVRSLGNQSVCKKRSRWHLVTFYGCLQMLASRVEWRCRMVRFARDTVQQVLEWWASETLWVFAGTGELLCFQKEVYDLICRIILLYVWSNALNEGMSFSCFAHFDTRLLQCWSWKQVSLCQKKFVWLCISWFSYANTTFSLPPSWLQKRYKLAHFSHLSASIF